jgi:branched-chain amino acid transport system ATP-binding protein
MSSPGGSGVTGGTELLVARGITKQYGGIVALDHVDMDVGAGEAVGVIGPNGAGKTTLFNCLFGLEDPDEGTVVFDGRRIDRLPVWKRSRMGIGRTFQRMELFEGMTVADHLLVAEQAASGTVRIWRDFLHRGGPTPVELHHVEEVLKLLGIADLAGRPVGTLDLGHARLVELGRAMMGAPRLLMLDEPSSGLDADDTARLSRILGETRRSTGVAVVLVEHDLALVESAVDRLVVLNFGEVLATGRVDEVLAEPEVRRAYLGSTT